MPRLFALEGIHTTGRWRLAYVGDCLYRADETPPRDSQMDAGGVRAAGADESSRAQCNPQGQAKALVWPRYRMGRRADPDRPRTRRVPRCHGRRCVARPNCGDGDQAGTQTSVGSAPPSAALSDDGKQAAYLGGLPFHFLLVCDQLTDELVEGADDPIRWAGRGVVSFRLVTPRKVDFRGRRMPSWSCRIDHVKAHLSTSVFHLSD